MVPSRSVSCAGAAPVVPAGSSGVFGTDAAAPAPLPVGGGEKSGDEMLMTGCDCDFVWLAAAATVTAAVVEVPAMFVAKRGECETAFGFAVGCGLGLMLPMLYFLIKAPVAVAGAVEAAVRGDTRSRTTMSPGSKLLPSEFGNR